MIYQIHTCTVNGDYEEGEDWLVEADSVEDADKKAKHFLWCLWFGEGDEAEEDGWCGNELVLDGGERRLTIEHIVPITFEDWVQREIEKQSMGEPVKFEIKGSESENE